MPRGPRCLSFYFLSLSAGAKAIRRPLIGRLRRRLKRTAALPCGLRRPSAGLVPAA